MWIKNINKTIFISEDNFLIFSGGHTYSSLLVSYMSTHTTHTSFVPSNLLTFGRLQNLPIFLRPANWEYKWGISIYPEVIALRIAIKVQSQPKCMEMRVSETMNSAVLVILSLDQIKSHFCLPTVDKMFYIHGT